MKKKVVVFTAIALVIALIVGALTVSAQSPSPTPAPKGFWGRGGKFMGRGWGGLGQAGLEAAAKMLNMTTEELSTQLWGGQTLADLADKANVDLQALRDAVDAANKAAMRERIEQAVEDGKLTREQADWLLQGLDQGYVPGRGRGAGKGGLGQAELEAAAKVLKMTAEQLSTQLWGGRTLAALAERANVRLEDVQAAVEAARLQAMREAINEAVEQGKMTREQADWLLKGLENNYIPRMRGRFGFGPWGGRMGGRGFGFGGLRFEGSTPTRSGVKATVGSAA